MQKVWRISLFLEEKRANLMLVLIKLALFSSLPFMWNISRSIIGYHMICDVIYQSWMILYWFVQQCFKATGTKTFISQRNNFHLHRCSQLFKILPEKFFFLFSLSYLTRELQNEHISAAIMYVSMYVHFNITDD